MKRLAIIAALVATNLLTAGVVLAVRPREATTRGTTIQVCFQPRTGRQTVDAGSGGVLTAGLLPLQWQMYGQAVFSSTAPGEPEATCNIPAIDIPLNGAFQTALENVIDTKFIPVVKATCNTP